MQQNISRYQRIMIQALINLKKTTFEKWRKECLRLKVSKAVFYTNRIRFIERDLITVNMDDVTPNIENIKTYFGKHARYLVDM